MQTIQVIRPNHPAAAVILFIQSLRDHPNHPAAGVILIILIIRALGHSSKSSHFLLCVLAPWRENQIPEERPAAHRKTLLA
jgi:hypothetical protein